MNNYFKSILLIALQVIFISYLILTTHWPFSATSIVIIVSAFILAFWAILIMSNSKLRISPIPHLNASLVTGGPYRFIRHPMYTSVLSGTAGLLLAHFTWLRLGIQVALFLVLIIKLNWEEQMLLKKFAEYKSYRQHTKKLIPFIY